MMEGKTYTWKEITEAYDVSRHTLQVWKVKFDTGGIDVLKASKTWRPYPMKQKIAAVRDISMSARELRVSPNITSVIGLFFTDGLSSTLVTVS
jgi:transposase